MRLTIVIDTDLPNMPANRKETVEQQYKFRDAGVLVINSILNSFPQGGEVTAIPGVHVTFRYSVPRKTNDLPPAA